MPLANWIFLSMATNQHIPWKQQEDDVILKHHKNGIAYLIEHLPKRSDRAIYKRAWKLGISIFTEHRRGQRRVTSEMLTARKFHEIEMKLRILEVQSD